MFTSHSQREAALQLFKTHEPQGGKSILTVLNAETKVYLERKHTDKYKVEILTKFSKACQYLNTEIDFESKDDDLLDLYTTQIKSSG